MEEQNNRLFSEFPLVGVADWEARIREDLKGADYEKKLIGKTLENIRIKPYYTAEDLTDLPYTDILPGQFPYIRGGKAGTNTWEIRQDFQVRSIETTMAHARLAVDRGVTAVGFDLTGKGDLYFHDFRNLIAGLADKNVSLNFMAGDASHDLLDYLLKVCEESGMQSASVAGSLGYDPLGQLAVTGGFFRSAEEDFQDADALLLTAENELPHFRVLSVNSHLFSDCGATLVQELAFGLAMAAEYLTRLTDMGHSASDITRHLQWNMGVGSDYFMQIAGIRAARLLYSALLSGFESDHSRHVPVYIHSITTSWNKTLYDPNVNLLRSTTEAMAAVIGGCDSLLVKPFDACYRDPGEFSERMARNIQIILKEEAYLDKVVDPAAGAYYVESLTDALVDHAWQLFLKVDERGGFSKAFAEGFIQEDVGRIIARRSEMVATRREVLVGTNQYPNLQELCAEHVIPEIAFHKITENHKRLAEPLRQARAAEPFEKLRLAVEKRAGGRPKVFMLTFGNLAMRLARSQFSGNFFACAGYEVIDNLGFASARDGVDAALKAKADIIVVCSSDEEYPQIAPEVAAQAAGKAIVAVAGAPASMEELKRQGISDFIHVRSNVLETLQGFNSRLGI